MSKKNQKLYNRVFIYLNQSKYNDVYYVMARIGFIPLMKAKIKYAQKEMWL
ncbi:MAG: hypothetical protein ACTSRZ_00305 [Promethearchaeota archaeon]